MGQHLGFMGNQNALRSYLVDRGIDPGTCVSFELIAHGPIFPEVDKSLGERAERMLAHVPRRNKVGAMEKALAVELARAGYVVLNKVNCNWPLDEAAWQPVRNAFAIQFPQLNGRGHA